MCGRGVSTEDINQRLYEAAKRADVDVDEIKKLLRSDYNKQIKSKKSPIEQLHDAATFGRTEEVRALLTMGVHVNVIDTRYSINPLSDIKEYEPDKKSDSNDDGNPAPLGTMRFGPYLLISRKFFQG